MQQQPRLHCFKEQQQMLGGGGAQAEPAPSPAAPTPPTPPTPANTQPTATQQGNANDRIFAAQGQQSTILATNVDTNQGVQKKALLGD